MHHRSRTRGRPEHHPSERPARRSVRGVVDRTFMTSALEKQRLRAEFRRQRSALADAVRASETTATVARCAELIARHPHAPLASYLACGGELDVSELHQQQWTAGAAVLVPRVAGAGQLTWHAIRSLAQTVRGAHGIREPEASIPAVPLPQGVLMLIPGVAFGANGARLGQGGGYYDRLLSERSIPGTGAGAVVSVGVGFSCQRCDLIPSDPHDQQVDGVILGGILVRDPLARLKP